MRSLEKCFQGKNNELLAFSFGEKDRSPYFCTPFDGAYALPDSIMVVQLILVQFVLVRIQVGQQKPAAQAVGFVFLATACFSPYLIIAPIRNAIQYRGTVNMP
jgi:hypothetical protein